jgi:hypothetical protein
MMAGRRTVFVHRDYCTTPTLRSEMDPNVPERRLTLMSVWYRNNVIAFLTAGFR